MPDLSALAEAYKASLRPKVYVPPVPQRTSDLTGVIQQIWTFAPDRLNEIETFSDRIETLDNLFTELRSGIEFVFRQKRFHASRPELLAVVEAAYGAYLAGDRDAGAKLVWDAQILKGKMR